MAGEIVFDVGNGPECFHGGSEVVVLVTVAFDGDPGVSDAGQSAQGALQFGGGHFLAADVRHFSEPSEQVEFTRGGPYRHVLEDMASARHSDCGASNRDTAVGSNMDGDATQRFADAATGQGGVAGSVVADAAGFAGAVEVVDLEAESLVKLLGDDGGKWRTGRDDQAQRGRFMRGGGVGQDAQHGGDGGENGHLMAVHDMQKVSGQQVAGDNDGHGSQDERHDQVAKSVGMTEWDDGEVAVGGTDSHRGHNLDAVR